MRAYVWPKNRYLTPIYARPAGSRARQAVMSHRLVFSPEALEQLAELYRYIAQAASPSVAFAYTEANRE